MRLRRAVLKIPPKSSVPPRSPLYKLRHLLTPSESTLPQLLIPLHFKSFISNAYKKRGVGCFRPAPKFVNSSLAPRHSSARATILVHFDLRPRGATDRATAHLQVLSLSLLDVSPQISENTSTLNPFAATLTGRVKPKSCVCHSYKKTPEGGYPSGDRFPNLSSYCFPNLSSRGNRGICFLFGLHGSRDTDHGPRDTDHGTPDTAHERLGFSARLRDLCASALSFSVFRCQAPLTTYSRLTAPPYSRKDSGSPPP
jgi:hypothetical protein